MRTRIAALIHTIEAHDSLEHEHLEATAAWIASDAPLFRVSKPDIPPQHLVSYFALVDPRHQRILLVDHKNAGLWLPAGGHVEPDEHPRTTVCRELAEELGLRACFLWDDPLFLTMTRTVGTDRGHTDVSLWYVLRGDSSEEVVFDRQEFRAVQWFAFDDIPLGRADRHMSRFVAKLRARLGGRGGPR